MGPIFQLELDELDGATAVSGTMLTDLSCHVKALPVGLLPAGAAWGREEAVRATGAWYHGAGGVSMLAGDRM